MWYRGSAAGQYAISFQGMYKNTVMTTSFNDTLIKKGKE